jgi:hypothetical protein
VHQDSAGQLASLVPARRSDAGIVRIGGRDIAGLMLCGEMYGAPHDLLAAYLDVRADRLRGIAARWRAAAYAETGRLGPGPAWCWLSRTGLDATGLHRPHQPGRLLGLSPTHPSVGYLHINTVAGSGGVCGANVGFLVAVGGVAG